MSREDGVKDAIEIPTLGKPAVGKKKKGVNRGAPKRGARSSVANAPMHASRENANADIEEDGFAINESDRAAMLRDITLQSKLPDPPKVPGVHWFWMTTAKGANPSIQWYSRIGYRIVRADDKRLKGWMDAAWAGRGGDYDGCVAVEEMILMWCPTEVYHQIMRVVHHDRPMEEGERLKESRRSIIDQTGEDREGRTLVREEGDDLTKLDRFNAGRVPGSKAVRVGSKNQFE